MRALTIGLLSLRRLFRDRTSIFFVFVLPFLIILAIGATFGSGFTANVGMVGSDGGPLARDVARRLEAIGHLELQAFDDGEALVSAVERGEVEAGLVLPEDYDADLRSGRDVLVSFFARPGSLGQELRLTVEGALDEQAAVLRAARFAVEESGAAFDEALALAGSLGATLPAVGVQVSVAGGAGDAGSFDQGAAQQLILFMFVTSLGASSQLIDTRRLGVAQRMLSTPTHSRTVILGETMGRFLVALFQGTLIVLVTVVAFGVRWGDPLGTAALVIVFALVGTGAAMLLGSALENAQQAGSLGTFLGLGLAALGGCMVPLEVFPETMRTIAHVTPHAWALDGFDELLRRGGGVGAIGPELLVLSGYALLLVGVAVPSFRRSITG